MQKIKFHQFILEIQSIWESCDQTGDTQTVFDQLFIYMNLYQHVEITGYFTDLFWRYGWLKNPAIWLAENILCSISGTKIFPNMQFVQEHSEQIQ